MTAKPSEGESVERGEGRDARVAKQAPTDARVRARRFETYKNIYWLATYRCFDRLGFCLRATRRLAPLTRRLLARGARCST